MKFAFTLATNEHPCPRCGKPRGQTCTTPLGKPCRKPHGERVSLLSPSQWDQCKGVAISAADFIKAKHELP